MGYAFQARRCGSASPRAGTRATPPCCAVLGLGPAGVKLGDADKILFWYRPEGAANYRVIYGDLHVSDVTEDRLPEKPKP